MQNPSVPISKTVNLAPLKPLYGLYEGTKPPPVYIVDGLKELIKDLLSRDITTFNEIARTAHTVSNFIQGKQIWQPNYWTGQWSIQSAQRPDPSRITSINIMQFYCTSQIKMFINSNPDIEPYDEFKQKEYKEKVRRAKAIWNSYESKFFTQWYSQQEALHAIVTGWYGESVEYDNLKRGAKVFKEVFGEKELQISPGYSKCFSCGLEGGYSDFVSGPIPVCPQCGSMEILPPEEPMTQKFRTITGVEPMYTGDLVLKHKSILNFRFDLKDKAEVSSWSITRTVMPRRKLEWMLGNASIPASDIRRDDGLKALDEIARASNTISGIVSPVSDAYKTDDIIVDKICLKPEDVAHIINREDTMTISGELIPKGQRLSDMCPPEGMTIFAINEGGTILGIFPGEHHSLELATGVYHMRWMSGLGRGSEDTVEVQKRFNRFDSQTVKFLEATASPARTYVKGSIDRAHVKQISYPNAVIPINQEVAQALGTTELIRQIQPGNASGNLFQYTYDILNQFRQLTSHVTDFSNAFPGVDNRTATGAQLAKTNADSIFAPMLQLKGEVRIATAENTLRLYNRHFQGVAKYFSFGESSSGQHIGDYLKGEDVDCEIKFTVVRNSEQPKTPYDRQADFVNMLAAAGQSGGYDMLKQQDPKLAQALLKTFDIDIDDNTYDLTVDVCETRLDEALNLQKQYFGLEDELGNQGFEMEQLPPEVLLMGLTQEITVEEPNHLLKAKWFSEYLDTPQGFALSNLEREVVRMFVRTHYQMEMAQQAAIAQGFAQVEAAAMGPQNEAAAAQAEGEKAAADEQAAVQHERDLENKSVDHTNNMELQQAQAGSAQDLAMMNAALQTSSQPSK